VHPQQITVRCVEPALKAIPAVWNRAGVEAPMSRALLGLVRLPSPERALGFRAQGKPDSAFCAAARGSLLSPLRPRWCRAVAHDPATSTPEGGRDAVVRSGLRPRCIVQAGRRSPRFRCRRLPRTQAAHGIRWEMFRHGFALRGLEAVLQLGGPSLRGGGWCVRLRYGAAFGSSLAPLPGRAFPGRPASQP